MTNINGQVNFRNNYRLQQQMATMPQLQQQAYINYLQGANLQDEVIFNTYSNDGNFCTDGKDDGKIGLFSALGNAAEGIVKTINKGIKGMFTGPDGKFSLGKTLTSVATAVVCTAFPAVGLVACAIGGTMGAVQVGKGIYNAATADTDAEAKRAWENIGSGTFTVGTSILGAKASMKAVNKSAAASKWGSAMDQLGKDASLGQKLGALGKDMGRSTAHNAKQIHAAAGNLINQAKANHKARVEWKNAKAEYKKAGKLFDKAKKSGWNESTYDAADNLKYAQDKLLAAEDGYKFSQTADKIKYAAQHPIKTIRNGAKAAYNGFKNNTFTGYTMDTMKDFSGLDKARWVGYGLKVDGQAAIAALRTMPAQAQSILAALTKGVPAESLISQYGYNNVMQVIQTVGGSVFADDAI